MYDHERTEFSHDKLKMLDQVKSFINFSNENNGRYREEAEGFYLKSILHLLF